MKIQYGEFTLGDAGAPGVSNVRMNGRRLVQQEDLLRAEEAFNAPRGNHRTTFSFTASRLHASVDEAQAFVTFHEADLPNQNDMVITTAGGLLVLTLKGACLVESAGHHMGMTSVYDYTFVAGKPVKGTGQ